MKELISNTLKGDYEAVLLAGIGEVATQANNIAQEARQAIRDRAKGQSGGEAQHTKDSHGQAQRQNNRVEQSQDPTG